MIPISLVFEDALSEMVMLRLLNRFGDKFFVGPSYGGTGNGYIKKGISGFNQASAFSPFFVLTDLDQYGCPPELIQDWLNEEKQANLIFRVAVKEVESWLLADRDGISDFIGVSVKRIPVNPELLADPKLSLINLARDSRKRFIKDDIVPKNDFASIGPNYNTRLGQFILNFWDVENAMNFSPSLTSAIANLQRL